MALTVVIGPPASGKSTWVGEHAQPGDIVIDYDQLATALSGPDADPHDHGAALSEVAFRARQAAIGRALRHTSTVDVYIIHALPRPEALAKYEQHGARVVMVDPGHDVVLERCKQQRPRAAIRVLRRWYAAKRRGAYTQLESGSPDPAQASPSRRW